METWIFIHVKGYKKEFTDCFLGQKYLRTNPGPTDYSVKSRLGTTLIWPPS